MLRILHKSIPKTRTLKTKNSIKKVYNTGIIMERYIQTTMTFCLIPDSIAFIMRKESQVLARLQGREDAYACASVNRHSSWQSRKFFKILKVGLQCDLTVLVMNLKETNQYLRNLFIIMFISFTISKHWKNFNDQQWEDR